MIVLNTVHFNLVWFIIALMIISILSSLFKLNRVVLPNSKRVDISLYALIVMSFQVLIGIIVTILNQNKPDEIADVSVLHIITMLVSYCTVAFGYYKYTISAYGLGQRFILWSYSIALILTILGINTK